MSLPQLTGTARLLTDPRKALTKTGKPMATVLLKFVGYRKVEGKWTEGDTVVASAIAFEDVARALVGFAKGDDVDVTGTATLGMWQDKPQLSLAVKTIAAHVRQKQAVAA